MRAHGERKQAPTWAIWANPIFRRYVRSRLRPKGLGVMLLLALLIAGFLFFVTRAGVEYRTDMGAADVARAPLIPLLILQGVILFFLGTGQVAGGMTAEGDEGVLDYQRLAPMTPLAKALGYLAGLPVREWLLVLATMPFTLWSLWKGEVPVGIAGQLYGVFFVAGVLYHLTGLVAGTVIKNRRWAFLVSMGAVFLLYTAVPQMARFGLVYFKYLTVQPVFEECLPYLVPRDVGAVAELAQRIAPPAKFFDLDLPQAVFTLFSQGVLIGVGLVMIWRRWQRAESHLLGKVWAVGLFAWVQLVLLGNALPLVETGQVFPSQNMERWLAGAWEPEANEAVLVVGVYGLMTLLMMVVLMVVITPERETQVRGWRRAHKLGQRGLPWAGDAATSVWWVLVMVGMGAGGWFVFAREIVGSSWFYGEVGWRMGLAFGLCLLTVGLGSQALVEGRGRRALTLVGIFVGVVPIMVGVVMAVSSNELVVPALWVSGISPVTGPIYAALAEVGIAEVPRDGERAVPRAFWFWQVVMVLVAARLIWDAWRRGRELRMRE